MNSLRRFRVKLQTNIESMKLLLHDGRFRNSKFGPRMRVRRNDYTRRIAMLREGPGIELYEDVFAEVSSLQPGMTFIDVGANAGLFTLTASAIVGAGGLVIAFEPSLTMFKDLIDNLAENRAGNVVPLNAALGQSDGIVRFDVGTETHSGIAHVSPEGSTACAQFRFDSLWNSLSQMIGERKIMVKIDIEGAEVQALRGMDSLLSNKSLEVVIIEINNTHLSRFSNTSIEIYTIFERHGFQPRWTLDHADHFNEFFSRIR